MKSREDDATKRHHQANIWFKEKWRECPRVKYYEAETKKEVTAMVKEEYPECTEFLVMEVMNPPREARHPETEG